MEKAKKIKTFKWISILEAMSLLLLLFLAMPLKYFFDLPQMVKVVGMAHGILFLVYIFGAFYMYRLLNWKLVDLIIAVVCSIIPFGPFYVEKRYL